MAREETAAGLMDAQRFGSGLMGDDVMHWDTGPDQTACGARVRVTGGTCALPQHNCTRDRSRVTCAECRQSITNIVVTDEMIKDHGPDLIAMIQRGRVDTFLAAERHER